MFRTIIKALVLSSLAIVVSGCGGPKGGAFEGKWSGTDKNIPASLSIVQERDIYHVEWTRKFPFSNEASVQKLTATAISDDVLSVDFGVVKQNLSLEKGHIVFESQEYLRTNQ